MKHKKSQSAVELIVIISGVLLFILSLLFVFQQQVAQKNYEKRNFLVQEVALTAQNELKIAASATDGYSREFYIPQKILNQEYNISLVANSVYIITSDREHALSLPVPDTTGDFVKGTNTIRKENSTVYLNS